MNRIELIACSLRCFVFSLVGLVPLLGIPASVVALVQYGQVMRRGKGVWNPAERYLNWGLFLGLFGLVLSFLVSAIVGIAIVASLVG